VDASSARRTSERSRWRDALVPGPLPTLPPAARCAALLRARLLLVALADTAATGAVLEATPGAAGERKRLERARAEVLRLGAAARAESLEAALQVCAVAEAEWLRAVAGDAPPGPGPAGDAQAADSRSRLVAVWGRYERSYASDLEGAARALEAALPPDARAAVPAAAYERAFLLEQLAPEPAAVLFAGGAFGPRPEARPLAGTWAVVLGSGALLGALAGVGVGRSLLLRERSLVLAHGVPAGLSPHAPPRGAEQAWTAELGWLHVVSGPDPARIANAATALADEFLARGERVLLLDAGKRLRLHECFGGDARWGLCECAARTVPLLGAVQATGHPGLFFLAHGASAHAERWDGLSQVLEEARAHFGRVLVTIDARVPREAALPLGGRVLEAWWAEPGPGLSRGALALSERLGIPFSCFDLNALSQVTSQGDDGTPGQHGAGAREDPGDRDASRTETAHTPDAALRELAPEGGELVPVPTAAEALGSAQPPAPASPPLGCDAEVRERLRFLVWMRRVQAEGRRTTLERGADG
jgi:hypothetical protein